MGTRKSNKKSNKIFRKTRSKRQRGGTINDELILASEEDELLRITDSKDYNQWLITDFKKVKSLIDKSTNVDARDRFGYTALMNATGNKYIDIVSMLLDKGANVNAKDNNGDKKTALHIASFSGNEEMVKLLLRHGADMNAPDSTGWTPREIAEDEFHSDIVIAMDAHNKQRHDRIALATQAASAARAAKSNTNPNTLQSLAVNYLTDEQRQYAAQRGWNVNEVTGKIMPYYGGKIKSRKNKRSGKTNKRKTRKSKKRFR